MVNKNSLVVLLLFALSCIRCKDNINEDILLDNIKDTLSLKQPVYDSIQVFVDFNKSFDTNNNSEYYLLEFLSNQNDSFNFVLTTIKKKSIDAIYLECPFFYNKDSSILIVNNGNNFLFENENVNTLSNIIEKNIHHPYPTVYNPLIWKLTITKNNHVIIDRFFGQKEAEKDVFIPSEKFKYSNRR